MRKKDVGKIRPRIPKILVPKLREKFPRETEKLDDEEVVQWALEQFLTFEPIIKEGVRA